MAVFAYNGRNQNGEAVDGAVDAASAEAAAQQLLAGGIYPININAQEAQRDEVGFHFRFGRKVNSDELIMLTRQLYSLSKAGVPLNKAIRGLSLTLRNQYFVDVLADIEKNLNSGVTLSAAMGRHIDVFPKLYVSLGNTSI